MTKKFTFELNGLNITADEGMTILEAALANDIYIPHLCYHEALEPYRFLSLLRS